MLEQIQRCPYCRRENKVSSMSYAENPFCNGCLNERLMAAAGKLGPVEHKRIGHYIVAVPLNPPST